MKAVLGIAALIGLCLLWRFLVEMWNEWSGAYGRWRRGEPLRLSDLLAAKWKAERERLERRKSELRQQHDLNPRLILDAAFRREFENLGVNGQLK